MLTPIIWKNLNCDAQEKLLLRPLPVNNEKFKAKIDEIIHEVRKRGDEACLEMTEKYDGVKISDLQVTLDELEEARHSVSESTIDAMKRVIQQLSAYHTCQKNSDYIVETSMGVICESKSKPIQRVGLYIPGGTSPLVSTTLMLGVPSQIAGCPLRVMCSPPKNKGKIDPNILVAAELCGISQIYKLGGAQAIAAMAYGTETIPKVEKIFGPGNAFVTQAKMIVAQDSSGAAYDLPAGPSEVMIIADVFANPEFIAADLLAQAEHGSDSQVFLVCTDKDICNKVNKAIACQIKLLSRQSIIEMALKNSRAILVDTICDALEIANLYAPEHLILQVENPRNYLEKIHSAGSIFLGSWSPVTAGDYVSGTNHVLPTDGYAKKLSGLSVRDFMKTISIQELTQAGLFDLADTIKTLSAIEGLDAHQRAVEIRLQGNINEK